MSRIGPFGVTSSQHQAATGEDRLVPTVREWTWVGPRERSCAP